MEQFFTNVDWSEIYSATYETMYMLGVSVFVSSLIGIPTGIILYMTDKGRILPNALIHNILSLIINVLRSVPFIILLIVMMPFTIALVGTSLGARGVIPPLIVGAFPFFARLVENSLKEITKNLGGSIEIGELTIEESKTGRLLPAGIFARWSK